MPLDRIFSWYRAMWLMVMFDLPTETPKDRENYRHFREGLLDDGFTQMQYSVYCRYCSTEEILHIHTDRVTSWLPAEGQIRIISFTDKQFERMQVFYGQYISPTEKPPLQVSMF